MTITEKETGRQTEGRVVGIAGPVIDVEFPRGALPELNTALEFDITVGDDEIKVLAEVAQRRPGAGDLHEADRRPDPRHERAQHGARHHRARRREGARTHLERLG